jgi:endonuclease YncB( thermonuclease family)
MRSGVGLDAPEVRGKEREAGLAATAYLKELLDKHAPDGKVLVRSFKAKQGKYGRFICSLEVRGTEGMIYICDLLVAAGHAVEKEY